MTNLTILGQTIQAPTYQLETFATPEHVRHVTLICDEFTSLCPVTKQPDFATITIHYTPRERCLESKSLKLYLWQYRERGVFAEQLTHDICTELFAVLEPHWCQVRIDQKPRGGIAITVEAEMRGPA